MPSSFEQEPFRPQNAPEAELPPTPDIEGVIADHAEEVEGAPEHVRQIIALQEQVMELESVVAEKGAQSIRGNPETIKSQMTEYLIDMLLSDEVQDDPGSVPIYPIGYKLLAKRLEFGEVPTADEVIGIGNVVEKQPVISAQFMTAELDENIQTVKEMTDPKTWELDDDQREWFKRVLLAPSMESREHRQLVDSRKPKHGKVHQTLFPKKHKKEHSDDYIHPQVGPSKDELESRYLTEAEIQRVKVENWRDNERLASDPSHGNYSRMLQSPQYADLTGRISSAYRIREEADKPELEKRANEVISKLEGELEELKSKHDGIDVAILSGVKYDMRRKLELDEALSQTDVEEEPEAAQLRARIKIAEEGMAEAERRLGPQSRGDDAIREALENLEYRERKDFKDSEHHAREGEDEDED